MPRKGRKTTKKKSAASTTTTTTTAAPAAPAAENTTYTVHLSNGVTKQVTRKRRVPIKKEIKQRLEEIFTTNSLPRGKAGTAYLHQLSEDTGLSYKQLRKWFDNRTQKEHLHEARALAVLTGKTEDLARPRQAYQKKYSVNKKAKHFISVADGGTKTDRSPRAQKKKKGPGATGSTKILDSIPSNSSAKKSAIAFGRINVSDEVKEAMAAINEYFNDTDAASIVNDELREDCFIYTIDCMKKGDRGVFKVSKSILERYNEKLYKALQTLFRNGSYEDLKTRILHEKPSIKTSLVWHALCNFHNREIDALVRSTTLMYDGCVDKNKAIVWLIGKLIPEYKAKIDLELQKRKDREKNKRKSLGGAGSSSAKKKAKTPAGKKKTPAKKTPKARSGRGKVRNV